MKLVEKLLDEKNEATFAFFWQLIGPLFVLCAFALMPHNTLLFIVGTVGLFLSAKFHMKGFYASCAVLGLGALVALFGPNAFWIIGVETSFALAFFITAQNADRQSSLISSLFSQMETKSSAITNLEDEFSKSKQETVEKQLTMQERTESLQKQLDEILSEQSSLNVLNEVLRKKTAKQLFVADSLQDQLTNAQIRLDFERKERAEMQVMISRLKNTSTIVKENQALIDEINTIRQDREQTHTINATLARLHAQESVRAKEALQQLEIYQKEARDVDSQEVTDLNAQVERLSAELQKACFERDQSSQSTEDLEKLLAERNALKDRLNLAEAELGATKEELKTKAEAVSPDRFARDVDKEAFKFLETKVKDLSHIEALYKQLRTQFDEKNQVLHKTRQELFQLDISFQTLQKEASQEDRMDPEVVCKEMAQLEADIRRLEEENQQLQDLITSLTKN